MNDTFVKQHFRNGKISKIIFFYILTETVFAFVISFLFFFSAFFVNQLLLMAREILSKKVPLYEVMLLLFYSLPSIIAMSTPFAALLGTLMTIGRLSQDNETLVMLTSGLSYKNIFAPIFLLAFVVSLFSFFVNDVLLPVGTIEFSKLYRRVVMSTPALEIESNSVKRFKDTVLITGNVTNNKIDDMLILDKTSDGERRLIMARSAEFSDSGKDGINLNLDEAFILSSKETERNDYDYASSERLSYRVQQSDILQAVTSLSPREMSSLDVYKEIKNKEVNVTRNFFERNIRTTENALILEQTLRNGPTGSDWNQRQAQLTAYSQERGASELIKNDKNLLLYRLEFYKKFSMPAGALSLVFLALPIGLASKKNGIIIGFLFGVIISVLYWACLLVGQNLGIKLGYSPFWTMWLPNIISISVGFVMCLQRVKK